MAVLTTSWDDGDIADPRLGELLARHGLRATFYATTGPTGTRAVGDDALAELALLGHEIANHGRSHTPFTELGPDALEQEIRWGWEEAARFGAASNLVAPPLGRIDRRVLSRLRALGATTRTAPILGPARPAEAQLRPTAQFYPHSRARTASHLARRGVVPAVSSLRAWFGNADLGDRVRALARAAANGGGVLHMWGHSREVERLGLWDELDRLLGELAALGFEPATNGELLDAGRR